MPSSDAFVIYGATGFTGRLLARAARELGLRPVLCARDEQRLAAVASSLELEHRAAPLPNLEAVLRDFKVVIHAAGPFSETFQPVVEACLRTGAHYLDVSGEAGSIEGVSRWDAEARRRGVMLMPGAGFDVVASDCLAAYVAKQIRRARRLSIGVSGLELVSRGSARTLINELGRPARIRRDGVLTDVAPGGLRRDFDYGGGPRASVAVGWGDVVSAYYTTGIPSIEVYFEETAGVRAMVMANRYFGWALGGGPMRRWMDSQVRALPEGPTDEQRAARRAVVVAEASDDAGRVARARLRTPEAYTFTCMAALAIASRVILGDHEPGFQTPARVFGSDLALSLPGVSLEDC
jgi:short subunit dehydrogenase-like uncharacterized protein